MQMIFAVKKQANKVTKGLRTFFKCFHEKKKKDKQIFTYHERSRSHATNTISTWNFLMVESGKKHFPVLFSGNMAQLMNVMGLLIFPFK